MVRCQWADGHYGIYPAALEFKQHKTTKGQDTVGTMLVSAEPPTSLSYENLGKAEEAQRAVTLKKPLVQRQSSVEIEQKQRRRLSE